MYQRLLRHFLLAGIGIALTLMPAFPAAISTTFDPNVFTSLSQNLTTVALSSSSGGYYTSDGVTIDLVQFIGLQNPGYFLYISGGVLQGPGSPGGVLHIVLPGTGYTAIGMNLATSSGNLTITPSTGGTLVGPSSSSLTFFGITSDTAITSLDISSTQGTLLLDNFQFGTAQPDQPVAEATTMILIGTGLLGLPFLRRMKLIFPA